MKTRVISAIVAIVLLIVVLVLSKTVVLPIALALLGALGVYEMFSASKSQNNFILLISSAVYAIVAPFVAFYTGGLSLWVLAVTFLYLFSLAVSMLVYFNKINIVKSFFAALMSVMIVFSMCASVELIRMEKAAYYFVTAALCAWITDTAALFVGKYFGTKKLAPVLSPNKTIEGALGGVVFCVLVNVLYTLFFTLFLNDDVSKMPNFLAVVFIPLLASIVGIVGDLFFSAIKRFLNIKDYGNIMPGHGGMLDRFDSFIFVSSFVVIAVKFFPLIG